MTKRLFNIGIIGAGKVGVSLAYALNRAGYNTAIWSRSNASLDKAASFVKGTRVMGSPAEVAGFAGALLITTSDSAVEEVARPLGWRVCDRKIFHTSGVLSIEALRVCRDWGAVVGSIHPLQTFATVENAIENLPGSYFGVTADEGAVETALEIVGALKGKAIMVRDEDKPVYHAAACVASNYLVSLIDYAKGLLEIIGTPPADAERCLMPLIEGTVANIGDLGTVAALTGPISRGDASTVLRQVEALDSTSPESLVLYRTLAERTIQLALEKGGIGKAGAKRLREALKGEEA